MRNLMWYEARVAETMAATEAIFEAAGDEPLTAEQAAQVEANRSAIEGYRREQAALSATYAAAKPVAGLSDAPSGTPAFATSVKDLAEDKPWASMGEFLQAVANAGIPHGTRDVRLQAAASGASQGVGADGGFLVQTDYSTALLDRARETSQLMSLCRSIPIGEGMDSIELPIIDETSRATGSRWGGVQVYRKAEADTVTASRPKLAELKIEALEMMGIAYATERLLQNAGALETLFSDAFTSEFAFKLDDEIVNGNGAGTALGILDSTAPTVSQAKETGQAAATVLAANLSKMWTHLPSRSKSRAVWLVNGEVGPQLDQLSIPAGTGALEPRIVTYSESGVLRIKGRPVIELEQCAALGTVGDVILADMSEYLLATKGGLQAAQSMHVRFLYNEMTFRWNYYINGRPTWKSSVTPFKGSATISPFVTLATRA